MESVKTAIPDLKQHLLAPDFFNARETPTIEFRSTDIRTASDGEVEADGDLTIRGVTKPVTAKGSVAYGENLMGAEVIRFDLEPSSPPRVRSRLAGPAAEWRRRAGVERRPRGPSRAGQGVIALRILGISGSLRRGSHNTNLLQAAADLLAPAAELETFDGLRELPPYDPDRDRERVTRRSRGCARRLPQRTAF